MKFMKYFAPFIVVLFLVGCGNKSEQTKKSEKPNEDVVRTSVEKKGLENIHLPAQVNGFELEKQPMIGSPKPTVTVVIGVDYTNPDYLNWVSEEYPNLLNQYLFTAKAKIYFINSPSNSVESKEAALAGETLFMQGRMQFDIFQNSFIQYIQDEKSKNADFKLTRDVIYTFLGYGNEIGWDPSVAQNNFDNQAAIEHLALDMAISKEMGVTTTPAVFVNDKLVTPGNNKYPTCLEIGDAINKASNNINVE